MGSHGATFSPQGEITSSEELNFRFAAVLKPGGVPPQVFAMSSAVAEAGRAQLAQRGSTDRAGERIKLMHGSDGLAEVPLAA